MLRRCIVRPSIRVQIQCLRQPKAIRYYSSVPEKSLPSTSSSQPSRPPNSRKWQLFAVIGLVGFTVGSWYRIIYGAPARDSFESFNLIAKEPVSSTASIFTIKPKGKLQHTEEFAQAWRAGIWNVQFKQPQLQIVRAYTPLPPTTEDDDDEETSTLRFLIRKDARGGEMSTYLHRLPIGSKIELRGPNVEYTIPANVKNVIFVAGGTGIAPALQVAHTMFDGVSEREKNEKTLHILWANRQREDCEGATASSPQPQPSAKSVDSGSASWGWALFGPKQDQQMNAPAPQIQMGTQDQPENQIVQHLNSLKSAHDNRISVSYFVDEEKSYITSTTLENALAAIAASANNTDKSPASQTQVIISGPPGFITYLAGPKIWQDGEEKQGPLGGRLAQVLGKGGKADVKVWKV